MSNLNGAKPPADPSRLTPNDWRRLRVALDGRDPQEVIQQGELEDLYQLLILAHRLREEPSFTWEQAGDVPPGDIFDFTGGLDGQSPPDLQEPPSSGSGSSPTNATARISKKKATGSGSARSSAATSA